MQLLSATFLLISFLVIEVAIGEYGISVDKLTAAVESIWSKETPVTPKPIKDSIEGNILLKVEEKRKKKTKMTQTFFKC